MNSSGDESARELNSFPPEALPSYCNHELIAVLEHWSISRIFPRLYEYERKSRVGFIVFEKVSISLNRIV
jgi:hypothetical protein